MRSPDSQNVGTDDFLLLQKEAIYKCVLKSFLSVNAYALNEWKDMHFLTRFHLICCQIILTVAQMLESS